MSIKINGNNAKIFKNSYSPVNYYKGAQKIAGWHDQTLVGTDLVFTDTYNDTAEVSIDGDLVPVPETYREATGTNLIVVENKEDHLRKAIVSGNTLQSSDYYAKDGLSSQVVTVQGVNLFDKDKAGNTYIEGNGDANVGITTFKSTGFILIPSNTSCRRTGCGTSINIYYTATKQYMSNDLGGAIINTPIDCAFVRFNYPTGFNINTIMVNVGSSLLAFAPFTPNSPSLDYPSAITSNLPANTYKYTSTDGIYEFTLAEELRGINTTFDKVVFDRVSHRGYLERRNAKVILNGTEDWAITVGKMSTQNFMQSINANIKSASLLFSDKFLLIENTGLSIKDYEWIVCDGNGQISISINKLRLTTVDVVGLKAWLSVNSVIVYYQLATSIRTSLTFTKVSSSIKTEVPMAFLTNTPSLDYLADVWSVESENLVSKTSNIVVNGNFANGTTGWISTGNSISVFNNELTLLATALYGALRISIPLSTYATKKYYIKADVKSTSSLVMLAYPTGNVYHTGSNIYEKLSVVYSSGANYLNSPFNFQIRDNRTSGWNNIYVKNVIFIDLTATFGIGNEPTKAQCDILFANWFDNLSTSIALPLLKKIGAVADTFNPIKGEKVQNISDWVTLDGSKTWGWGGTFANFKSMYVPSIISKNIDEAIQIYKNDSTKLTNMNIDTSGNFTAGDQCCVISSDGTFRLSVSNNDSGIGFYSPSPIQGDMQPYFYGWKMCNVDSSAPYYKSEVPYTPSTWAEWTKSTGVVGGSTGIEWTSDSTSTRSMTIPTSFKPNTKYGFLYTVVLNTITGTIGTGGSDTNAFTWSSIPVVVGNNKQVLTSLATITLNKLLLYNYTGTQTAGNKIKFKDIRIFELPTGSQIETDFTTLTADQLSAKYTFNGLCVKNWKHVTDGLGQTATLPTASYAGYTPYKMIYQLATPVVTTQSPATVPLYPNVNSYIESDGVVVKPDILVGYQIKDSTVRIGGDITPPTPDYPSVINSAGSCNVIGRTLNLVSNGNFANGITGWIAISTTLVTITGICIYTPVAQYGRVNQDIPNHANYRGHKLYFTALVKTEVTNNLLYLGDGVGQTGVAHSTNNVFEKLSGIKTIATTSTGLYIKVQDARTSGWTETQVDNFMVIDMGKDTSNLLYNKTQTEMDTLFPIWQDKLSTQATLPIIRKVGTVVDTYNPVTGEYVQRINKIVLNGTESMNADNTTARNISNYIYLTFILSVVASSQCTCSHLPYIPNGYNINGSSNISVTVVIILNIINSVTGVIGGETQSSFVSKIKAWLVSQYNAGTPVTVYYQLQNPITTYLTPTALPTYPNYTKIEQDGVTKGVITAKVKVLDNI